MVWAPIFMVATTNGYDFRYCVPLDGHRPEFDLKFYKPGHWFRPERCVSLQTIMTVFIKHFKVPIIVVFTKYDQFLRNVRMDMLEYPDIYMNRSVSEVANKRFQEYYVHPLGDSTVCVRTESEWKVIC